MTREEAIKVLKKDLQIIDDPNVTMTAREWEEHDDHMRDALEMAIQVLEQEPKREKWEHYLKEGLKWKCSGCGSRYTVPWSYCPNCGARMESDGE